MMTRGLFAMVLGMALFLAACTSTSEPDPRPALPRNLVGVWVLEGETAGGIRIFTRSAALSGNHPGYEFGEHGGLKVRKSGWCGTPPATWSNHEGLWNLVDNRHLKICHTWRGGPREYQLEILSLGPRRMTCRVTTGSGS